MDSWFALLILGPDWVCVGGCGWVGVGGCWSSRPAGKGL